MKINPYSLLYHLKPLYLTVIVLFMAFTTGHTQCIISDDFSSGNSSGGTGWANNWTFNNATIVSGELLMNGGEFGTADRTIDLSGQGSATLSFTFKCIDSFSGFHSADFVRVRISTDGGTTFTDYWYRDGNQVCPETNDSETHTANVVIPGGGSTIIRLESGTSAPNEDAYWDDIVIDRSPVVRAFAIQASCTTNDPNDDAYLQLSEASGNRYHYSLGSSFDDNSGGDTYSNATSLASVTYPLLLETDIDNPSSSQDYTIRIYGGSNSCYTDITITLMPQDCVTGCRCEEYIYLNDTKADAIHKFLIEPDGTLEEILNGTNTWLSSSTDASFIAPHGLAMDLNGFLYVAETQNGDLRKLSCDGSVIDEATFVINDGGTNFGTIENLLFINSPTDKTSIQAYDLCCFLLLTLLCHIKI